MPAKRLFLMVASALAAHLVLAQPAAVAEERIALVIGNGSYRNTSALANPPNDVRLMAAALKQLGFEVTERIDIDQKTMKQAIVNFGKRLTEGGDDTIGVFYYAGHGVQVQQRNYMIPIGAQIRTEAEVDIEAVPADAVLAQMEYARSRLNFVILDACRNNPFARSFRSTTRGLARMDAPTGTLIAYATAPGDVAEDGGAAPNSPYAAALAKHLGQPGVQAEEMFRKVRLSVMRETGDRQTPWESSSLTGAFYFGGGKSSSQGAQIATPAPAAPPTADKEIVFWRSVEAGNSAADYRAYLEHYPEGTFAALARARIAALTELKSAERQVSPSPATAKDSPYPHDGRWKGSLRTYGGRLASPTEATFRVVVSKGQLRGTVYMYGQTRTIQARVTTDGSLVGGRLEGRNSYVLSGSIRQGHGDAAFLGWKLEYRMSRE